MTELIRPEISWSELEERIAEGKIKTENKMIFIKGNVPSSKNSKRVIRLKNGKTLLINSSNTMDYKKSAIPQFTHKAGSFEQMTFNKPLPYHIEFTFIRDSKRMFDFVNMAQVLLDLMQECGWIENDDYKNVVPYFNPVVVIDKDKAGVEIRILN